MAVRLGHPRPTALTLGRAVASRFAQTKGARLGILPPAPGGGAGGRSPPALQPVALPTVPTHPAAYRRQRALAVMGETFPVELVQPVNELHAVVDGRPAAPQQVQRSLQDSFGADLAAVESAMAELAASRTPEQLQREAYQLYVDFRPDVPSGVEGWGAKGPLHVSRILELATSKKL